MLKMLQPTTMESRRDRVVSAVVLAGVFAIAIVFSRASFDMYRLPKTLLLRGEAILIIAVVLGAMICGVPLRVRRPDPGVRTALIAFAAMTVVTMASTRPALSADALASAAATLVVFLATVYAARDRAWTFVTVPLAAAFVNAALTLAEATDFWTPFGVRTDLPRPLQNTALVGNPNEVGGYLGVAALAALAALYARRNQPGTAWRLTVVASLVAALVASRSLTAMIACVVAGIVMCAMQSWKAAIVLTASTVVVAAVLVAMPGPFRERAENMVRWARNGDYNALLTERATPFVAASLMFADHPWTGVGPDAFAWHYYDYKVRAEERYPALRNAYNRGVNYGEVHNDHLQMLAEGGVTGYAVFLFVIGTLAARSFGGADRDLDPRYVFARRLALPLAVFWFVLSLAQFPVETAVVRTLLAHFAALCIAWRTS